VTPDNWYLIVCREEKIKRALRQQKHASAASETASSDRSRTDRDSVEVKPTAAGAFTLPLAAAPERGILKKGASLGSVGGGAMTSPLPTTGCRAGADGDGDRRQRLLSPAAAAVSNSLESAGFEFIDGVEEEDDASLCSCSCDEDEPPPVSDADAARAAETEDCSGPGGCNVETQTDAESLTSSMTSVCDSGDRMTRLCNINELLRQIDEQFNSVLRSASMNLDLSPANSDDVRGSETEADRACPGKFFSRTADDASDDAKLDGRVVGPVPLVPDGLSAGEMAAATDSQAAVPYRGITSSLPTASSSADRLLSPVAASGTPATSEAYHVPPVEPELPLIIREIPRTSAAPLQCVAGDCGMRPPSKHLNSPDDVDV